MGRYGQAVFSIEADIKDDDVGWACGVSPVERSGAVESMYVQSQPAQARDHFLSEAFVTVDEVDEGRRRDIVGLQIPLAHRCAPMNLWHLCSR